MALLIQTCRWQKDAMALVFEENTTEGLQMQGMSQDGFGPRGTAG